MPNYLPSLKRLLRLLAILVGVWVCAVALLAFCIPAEPARPDPFRLAAPVLFWSKAPPQGKEADAMVRALKELSRKMVDVKQPPSVALQEVLQDSEGVPNSLANRLLAIYCYCGHNDVFFCNQLGPCALFRNNGDGTFEDVTHKAGMACPRSSRSAACADFDGDGRLDLVANNFNDRPCYFRNRLPPRNYLALRLQGTRSNRDAIGAVVRPYAGKEVMTRQVSPASGYLAQSSKTVHFGLGDRAQIDRVEIVWPSGTVQTLDRPAINVLHPLTEGEKKDAPRH